MALELLLEGKRLTTVEIYYYLPDHPDVLQTFLWQDYDLPPEFPRILQFLEFWSRSIEGRLHSVQIAAAGHLFIPSSRVASFYEHLN